MSKRLGLSAQPFERKRKRKKEIAYYFREDAQRQLNEIHCITRLPLESLPIAICCIDVLVRWKGVKKCLTFKMKPTEGYHAPFSLLYC